MIWLGNNVEGDKQDRERNSRSSDTIMKNKRIPETEPRADRKGDLERSARSGRKKENSGLEQEARYEAEPSRPGRHRPRERGSYERELRRYDTESEKYFKEVKQGDDYLFLRQKGLKQRIIPEGADWSKQPRRYRDPRDHPRYRDYDDPRNFDNYRDFRDRREYRDPRDYRHHPAHGYYRDRYDYRDYRDYPDDRERRDDRYYRDYHPKYERDSRHARVSKQQRNDRDRRGPRESERYREHRRYEEYQPEHSGSYYYAKNGSYGRGSRDKYEIEDRRRMLLSRPQTCPEYDDKHKYCHQEIHKMELYRTQKESGYTKRSAGKPKSERSRKLPDEEASGWKKESNVQYMQTKLGSGVYQRNEEDVVDLREIRKKRVYNEREHQSQGEFAERTLDVNEEARESRHEALRRDGQREEHEDTRNSGEKRVTEAPQARESLEKSNLRILLNESNGLLLFYEDSRKLQKIDSTCEKAFKEDLGRLHNRGKTISRSQRVWDFIDNDSKIQYDSRGRPQRDGSHTEYWRNLEEQGLIVADDKDRVSMSPKYWALLERNQEDKAKDKDKDKDKDNDMNKDEKKEPEQPRQSGKGEDRVEESMPIADEKAFATRSDLKLQAKSNQGSIFRAHEFRNEQRSGGDTRRHLTESQLPNEYKSLYYRDWQMLTGEYMLVEYDTGERVHNSRYGGDWVKMEQDRIIVVDKNSGQMLRPSVYFQHRRSVLDERRASAMDRSREQGPNADRESAHQSNESRRNERRSQMGESERHGSRVDESKLEETKKKEETIGESREHEHAHNFENRSTHETHENTQNVQKTDARVSHNEETHRDNSDTQAQTGHKSEHSQNTKEKKLSNGDNTHVHENESNSRMASDSGANRQHGSGHRSQRAQETDQDDTLILKKPLGLYYRPSAKFSDSWHMEREQSELGLFDPHLERFVSTSVYEGDWEQMERDGLVIKSKRTGYEIRPSVYFQNQRNFETQVESRRSGKDSTHAPKGPEKAEKSEHGRDKQDDSGLHQKTNRDSRGGPGNESGNRKSIYERDFRLMERAKGQRRARESNQTRASLYQRDWDRMESRRAERDPRRDRLHSIYDFDRRMFARKAGDSRPSRMSLRPSTLAFLNEDPRFYQKKQDRDEARAQPSTLENGEELEKKDKEESQATGDRLLRRTRSQLEQSEWPGNQARGNELGVHRAPEFYSENTFSHLFSKVPRNEQQNQRHLLEERRERVSQEEESRRDQKGDDRSDRGDDEDKAQTSRNEGTEGDGRGETQSRHTEHTRKDRSREHSRRDRGERDSQANRESRESEGGGGDQRDLTGGGTDDVRGDGDEGNDKDDGDNDDDDQLYPPRRSRDQPSPGQNGSDQVTSQGPDRERSNEQEHAPKSGTNAESTPRRSENELDFFGSNGNDFENERNMANSEFRKKMEKLREKIQKSGNENFPSNVMTEKMRTREQFWSGQPRPEFNSDANIDYLYLKIQKLRELDDQSDLYMRKTMMQPEVYDEDSRKADRRRRDTRPESTATHERDSLDFISSNKLISQSGLVGKRDSLAEVEYRRKHIGSSRNIEQGNGDSGRDLEGKEDLDGRPDEPASGNGSRQDEDPNERRERVGDSRTAENSDKNGDLRQSQAEEKINNSEPGAPGPEEAPREEATDRGPKVETDNQIIKRVDISGLLDSTRLSGLDEVYLRVIEAFMQQNDLKIMLENVILEPKQRVFTLKLKHEQTPPPESADNQATVDNRVSFGEQSQSRRRVTSASPDSRVSRDSGRAIDLSWAERKFAKKFRIHDLSEMTRNKQSSFIQRKQELGQSILFHQNRIEIEDPRSETGMRTCYIEEVRDPLEFEECYIIKHNPRLKAQLLEQKQATDRELQSTRHELAESDNRVVCHVDFVLDEDYMRSLDIERSQLEQFPVNQRDEVVKRFLNVYYHSREQSRAVSVEGQAESGPLGADRGPESTGRPVDGRSQKGASRREIDHIRTKRLKEAKKKILTSPVVSSRSIYHRNCGKSDVSVTSDQKRQKEERSPWAKEYPFRKRRTTSHTNLPSSRSVKGRSRQKKRATRSKTKSKSPKNATYRQPRRKPRASTSRKRLPPKFGKNYYDRNPEFYYKMNRKLAEKTETPENEWNLDGPSFVSYMPSFRNNRSPDTNFYDQDSGRQVSVERTRPVRRAHQAIGPQKEDGGPARRGRHDRSQSPSFRTMNSPVSYEKHPNDYEMSCDQRPYYVKRYYKSPKSRGRNGLAKPEARMPSYLRVGESGRESGELKSTLKRDTRAGSAKRDDPKLHPLQFCNFCDNYFHEQCFKDYYNKNKRRD